MRKTEQETRRGLIDRVNNQSGARTQGAEKKEKKDDSRFNEGPL